MSYPHPGQGGGGVWGGVEGGPGVAGGVPSGVAHLPQYSYPPLLQIQGPVQQFHPAPPPLYHHSHNLPGFVAVQQCGAWPVLSQPLPLPGAMVGYGVHPHYQPLQPLQQPPPPCPTRQSVIQYTGRVAAPPYQPVGQQQQQFSQPVYHQQTGYQQQGMDSQQGF